MFFLIQSSIFVGVLLSQDGMGVKIPISRNKKSVLNQVVYYYLFALTLLVRMPHFTSLGSSSTSTFVIRSLFVNADPFLWIKKRIYIFLPYSWSKFKIIPYSFSRRGVVIVIMKRLSLGPKLYNNVQLSKISSSKRQASVEPAWNTSSTSS